jgi:hypothetical protein
VIRCERLTIKWKKTNYEVDEKAKIFVYYFSSKLGGLENNQKQRRTKMKKRSLWVVVGMLFVVFLMSTAVASADMNQWSYGVPILTGSAEGGSVSGKQAMVTMTGTVKKIEAMKGIKDGLQMQFIAEAGGNWVVYMGPKWFIENQKIKFMAGDKVEVRGKKFGGAVVASEISKGDWTMKLRNEEDGMAVWQCCFPYKERKD